MSLSQALNQFAQNLGRYPLAPTLKLPIIPISPSNCDNATAFCLIKWKRDLNLSNAQSAFEQQFVHEVLPMIFVLHSRSVSC